MTRDSSRKLLWGGVAVAVVAVLVAIAVIWQNNRTSSPVPTVARKVESPPAATPSAPKPVATSPQPTPVPPPKQATPAKTATNAIQQGEMPRFDIVRVDPSGHAVLAGRAAPGSEVTVFDAGKEIGHVTADKDGNWVLIPDQPLPIGQSQLTLSAKAKDGTVMRSDGVVAMLVPERGTTPAPSAVSGSQEVTAASVPTKAEAPIAVLVPKEGPATALQLPPLKGQGDDRLSMDIIEYGTKGDVILEGRAAPGARIDAFLDNTKIGTAIADGDGKWRIVTSETVPPARYRLKLESHNRAGKEVAQLAMPFERATLPEQLPDDLVIVQPGNSLWRIARRSYGRGRRYVEIYHANRNQISNPQLIYPGQLLQLPGKS